MPTEQLAVPILLVGSLPSESRSPREVFELVSTEFGDLVKQLPDGEQNDRGGWFWTQIAAVQNSPSLEPDDVPAWATGRTPEAVAVEYADVLRRRPELLDYYRRGYQQAEARAAAGGMRRTSLRLRDGCAPGEVVITSLGVAHAELDSYSQFVEARDAGTIPSNARYQMPLPTPWTFLQTQVRDVDIRAVLPAYERALAREIEELAQTIPARDLCVQWDAVEFNFGWLAEPAIERVNLVTHLRRPKYPLAEIVGSVLRVSAAIPPGAAIGLHLCYGDAIWGEDGTHHATVPEDTGLMVEYANQFAGSGTPVSYVHMPVPIERDDDAYFAPLQDLRLAEATELYLGIVHEQDGIDGAVRRATAARKFVGQFGVAAECGLGRRPPGTTKALLALHREAAHAGHVSDR